MPKPLVEGISLPEDIKSVVNTRYYQFTNCCDTDTPLYLSIDTTSFSLIPNGVYTYLGGLVVGTPTGYDPVSETYIPLQVGACYTSELLLTDISTPINNGADYALLTSAPNFSVLNYNQVGTSEMDCSSPEVVASCPECDPICYLAVTCDGLSYITSNDLSAHLGTTVTITFPDTDLSPTCASIVEAPSTFNCEESINIVVDELTPCECDCRCFSVTGAVETLIYVDCTGNLVQESMLAGVYGPFCARTSPVLIYSDLENPPVITENGDCVDPDFDGIYVCPDFCYTLTDCEGIESVITTNTNLYLHYTSGHIIKIAGSDTCWIVGVTQECDCAISVSVQQYFTSCENCVTPRNYILTSCDNPLSIVYTSTDLSSYIDKVIRRDDCEGCWLVTEFLSVIPNDTDIIVVSDFDTCESCNTIYYSLEDCSNSENILYTTEDLSNYLSSVITLKWCPNICWTVSVTETPGTTTLVIPDLEYTECEECLATLTCICVRVQNITSELVVFNYRDCEGQEQTLEVQPESFSAKLCIGTYTINESLVIREFGNCIDGICPVPVYNYKPVKPGYNTKTCSIAYYDKITCNYSERIYKDVLFLRYGIGNCCEELVETYKLFIKNELLQLDVIYNPDYECSSSGDCGCDSTVSYSSTCTS